MSGWIGAWGTTATVTNLIVTESEVISVNTSTDALRITQTGSGNALLVEDDTHTDSTAFVIDSTGNVGIGQNPPASKFHVRQDQDGTTRTIIQNRNATGTPLSELTFISSTLSISDNRYAYIQSGGGGSTYLSFGTSNAGAPTERMQIAANGYVGIGTAPAAPFHAQSASTSVIAIISASSNTTCNFVLRNSVTTSNNTRIAAESSDLTLTTGGTERMRVTSTGNIHGTSGTTAMTDGFFYIPSAAGAPSGVPTAIAGRVPMYYDSTNNNFYVYNGAWKKVLLG